jgi:outer membrane protein, heavy metal efflux system
MNIPRVLVYIIITCSLLIAPSLMFPQVDTNVEQADTKSLNTLEDYLAYAAMHNPGLESAFNHWKAALEKIPQVTALPDPRFNFAYMIREIETRVGPQQAKVGFMQMFPWFGKLKLKGSAALEAANAVKQQYQTIKLDLFNKVKNAYYEYHYVSHAISVITENIQLLEYLEATIRSKYRTGNAAHTDLIKVQVELDKLQDQLKSTQELLFPVKARINAALNRSPRSSLVAPGKIQAEIPTIDYDQLVTELKQHNPQLKTIHHIAAREKFNIKLAAKNYYPDVSIGLDYMFTGATPMPGVADSGKDPLAAMISFNIPIHVKKIKASIRYARFKRDAAIKLKQDRENNLLARLEMVHFQFRDSRRKLTLYKDALIPRAEQALEVTRSAFESGKVDSLNLIDSQRTLLKFELAYQRAQATLYQRLAELEMMVGKELEK